MKRYSLAVVSMITVLVLMAAMFAGLTVGGAPATAAPAAIPTPASVTRPSAGGVYATFNPFAGTASITADTTSTCFDIGKYSVIDVLYRIDQHDPANLPNTTTLTTKWSVDGSLTVSGINVVASNAADASDMTQLQAFGRYFCLLADVSNTQPITITAQAIAK